MAVQKQLDEIKAMLKAGAAAQAQAPHPAPAPAIATVDHVIDIAGAAVKGAPTARVAIIEFSDYECPFCGRHALNTLPELAKRIHRHGQSSIRVPEPAARVDPPKRDARRGRR